MDVRVADQCESILFLDAPTVDEGGRRSGKIHNSSPLWIDFGPIPRWNKSVWNSFICVKCVLKILSKSADSRIICLHIPCSSLSAYWANTFSSLLRVGRDRSLLLFPNASIVDITAKRSSTWWPGFVLAVSVCCWQRSTNPLVPNSPKDCATSLLGLLLAVRVTAATSSASLLNQAVRKNDQLDQSLRSNHTAPEVGRRELNRTKELELPQSDRKSIRSQIPNHQVSMRFGRYH